MPVPGSLSSIRWRILLIPTLSSAHFGQRSRSGPRAFIRRFDPYLAKLGFIEQLRVMATEISTASDFIKPLSPDDPANSLPSR
jgi:hypothetical protein